MRGFFALVSLALALVMLAPPALGNSVTGRAFGETTCAPGVGGAQRGLAQIFFARNTIATASTETISLDWTLLAGVSGDYDLWLFKPGAADDGVLGGDEVLASSESHVVGGSHEAITWTFAPGADYVVVVVPYHAQGQAFALGSPGVYVQYGVDEPLGAARIQTGGPASWDATFVGGCPA